MAEMKNKGLDESLLPQAPEPLGLYSAVSESNGLIFLSGMLPLWNGRVMFAGNVSKKEKGREAAHLATLNALAALRKRYGNLNRIRRAVQAAVYIATDANFQDHAFVADGCSGLLEQVFSGGHSRLVFGVSSLPKSASVELALIFELDEEIKKQGENL